MTGESQHYNDYRGALERFLSGAGEDALASGYEIGRRMMAEGFGILEVVSTHYRAISDLLPDRLPPESASLPGRAGEFLIETLSPYDISHRGVGEANMALRRLNELLEDDLKRIAHALHDQAGSILASASIELDLVAKDISPDVRRRLVLVRRLLEETGEKLRHFSHELRPTLLDDLGLGAALDYLAEGIEQRSSVRVILSVNLRERPASVVETALYRIIQEALNNAVRHAGDSPTVTVLIERDDDVVRCLVADDGPGFDVTSVLSEASKRGMGLLCMRERAQAVGGMFEIRSSARQGTTIEIVVPLKGTGDRKL